MAQSTQNTKAWALLVGINHYPLLAPRYQLRGCINDVLVISQVLQDKLPGINVTLLTSTDALNLAEKKPTRENIMNALDHLISVTNEGDIVVIYYSGHGSRYSNPHKHTGHNEAIVPCDSGDPSCDILDDELHTKMQGLTEKTYNVTLIFDSCHSESITRDPFGGMARFVPPRKRAESMPTPKTLTGAAAEGPSGWLPLNRRYVLLSGCRSDEYSFEYPVAASTSGDAPITHGAWTYFLCDALRRAGPGTTYRDLLEKAAPLVTAKFPRQHPQLEGSPDRELFGVKEIVPTPFVLVESYDEHTKTARLAAGAAVGMTIKSCWGVYPEGTRKPDQHKTGRIAVLEVTKVNVTSSEAKVIEGGNIMAGTRAFEESHHAGEMRLKVFVQGPTQPQPETVTNQLKLLQQLMTPADDNSGLLRQVADEMEADVKVYLLESRKGAKEGDPLPQWTTPVINPLWVVVGKDGKILMPSHQVNHTETLEVYDNLERVARFRQGLRIENNDPDNALQGKIEFHITKLDPSSRTWTKVESPEQQVGTIRIQEGERVGGAITNDYHETVYVAVLEFGESGGVNVLYPAKGVSEPLAPHQTARFGDEFGPIRIAQRFKDMCAALPSVDAFTQPEATLKVFATLQPMDFGLLEQDHYKAVQKGEEATPNTSLGNLLALAFAGSGNREFTRLASTTKEPWVTVQKSFVLHAAASS